MKYYIVLINALVVFVSAQSHQQYTTPVPILKQINKHNEDGSYSYGYEGADGTFKIETKYPSGEVFGKYGYVDDTGKLREIEYGATKRGFEPQGNDINVAPPTIHNNQQVRPLGPEEEDDGQYREDPSMYYKEETYNQPQQQYKSTYTPRYTQPTYQPQYQQQYQHQPQYQQQQPRYQQQQQEPQYQQQSYRPSTKFNFDDFISNRPQSVAPLPIQRQYNTQPSYNQNYYNTPFTGHPATNVDLNLGSYTVNYR
ncbi:hypothetical protein RN001_004586 [Aquatica leii]|uniref:Uncharacterized protein n=1 Tax=Aquatica leii TaxID=1421715 RepID=A0AAN7SHI7_9COLE|nr:hypothetical protein RN001_004586 [Aquatica leii]